MAQSFKRVTFIGDVHGLTTWEKIARTALTEFSEVVFLGDYVDSFNVLPIDILDNLKKIIEFKKQYPDKVTLLLGNHDYAYVYGKTSTSGFNSGMWHDYKDQFVSNWDLFNIAWGHLSANRLNKKDQPLYTLATHAGLTTTYHRHIMKGVSDPDYAESRLYDLQRAGVYNDSLLLHEILNLMKDFPDDLWKVGRERGGWSFGGVLWADKYELERDNLENIDQVVGHTPHNSTTIIERKDCMLHFVDCRRNENIYTLQLEL
jgi:hypothetical protein